MKYVLPVPQTDDCHEDFWRFLAGTASGHMDLLSAKLSVICQEFMFMQEWKKRILQVHKCICIYCIHAVNSHTFQQGCNCECMRERQVSSFRGYGPSRLR